MAIQKVEIDQGKEYFILILILIDHPLIYSQFHGVNLNFK